MKGRATGAAREHGLPSDALAHRSHALCALCAPSEGAQRAEASKVFVTSAGLPEHEPDPSGAEPGADHNREADRCTTWRGPLAFTTAATSRLRYHDCDVARSNGPRIGHDRSIRIDNVLATRHQQEQPAIGTAYRRPLTNSLTSSRRHRHAETSSSAASPAWSLTTRTCARQGTTVIPSHNEPRRHPKNMFMFVKV